jgi:hypothetical protein
MYNESLKCRNFLHLTGKRQIPLAHQRQKLIYVTHKEGVNINMKLNPGLPWQMQHSTRRRLLSPPNWT